MQSAEISNSTKEEVSFSALAGTKLQPSFIRKIHDQTIQLHGLSLDYQMIDSVQTYRLESKCAQNKRFDVLLDEKIRIEFFVHAPHLWQVFISGFEGQPELLKFHRETWAIDQEQFKAACAFYADSFSVELAETAHKITARIKMVSSGTKPQIIPVHMTFDKKNASMSFVDDQCNYIHRNLRIGYRPAAKASASPAPQAALPVASSTASIEVPFDAALDSQGSCIEFDTSPEDVVYGLGERGETLRRNNLGRSWICWNTDFASYRPDDDPLYQSIPFALFKTKNNVHHGLFVDNTGYQLWNTEQATKMRIELDSQPLRFYVFSGHSLKNLVQTFTLQMTGTTPMPPLWALGYQQCRWSYYPAKRVLDIADGFRSRKIPLDALYLDIDYMDKYRCFTWDKERFPDPCGLVKTQLLEQRGIRTVCIVDPGIAIDASGKYDVYNTGIEGNHFIRIKGKDAAGAGEEKPLYVGEVWPGPTHMPNFLSSRTRSWWADQYKGMVETGVEGYWNDMNEVAIFQRENKTAPDEVIFTLDSGEEIYHKHVHNIYGQGMIRGTREGLEKYQPSTKRPFVLTRAAYAGIQRYCWSWSGDNTSSWESMRGGLPILLSMGLGGQVGVGADIGGFNGDCNAELYARWIELAFLHPVCRTHTIAESIDQEPWSFGSEVEQIAKKLILARYALMPYLYTQFYLSAQQGLPLLRPLWFDFSDDERCHETEFEDTQFLVGDAILVAPVLHENARNRRVYLPKGTQWYELNLDNLSDTKSMKVYEGGLVLDLTVPLDRVPVFVKAGTVVPVRAIGNTTINNVFDLFGVPLEFIVFGDAGAHGMLFLDDGLSRDVGDNFGLYELLRAAQGVEKQLIAGKGFPMDKLLTAEEIREKYYRS